MKTGFKMIIEMISFIVLALVGMAFFTLLERKILGYLQFRKGPNKVSFLGLLQPISDALKLFTKEVVGPYSASMGLMWMGPSLGLFLALLFWGLCPSKFEGEFTIYSGVGFILISSCNVYPLIISGWGASSSYSFLGAFRGVAQSVSYEVSLITLFMCPLVLSGTSDFFVLFEEKSVLGFVFPGFLVLWMVSILAESNRTPFDFAEGESELVSGFNTEFSGGLFALIFMGEYTSIMFMSLVSGMFLGGPLVLPFFGASVGVLFIWSRGVLPRLRYDMLMYLVWKAVLPLSLLILLSVTLVPLS